MKFIYVDESGKSDHTDVFVMCGLMVDAYRLRKKTEEFDQLLQNILSEYPGSISEFKTSRFINGRGKWKNVDLSKRKKFLRLVCQLAIDGGGKIYGIALSFEAFNAATNAGCDYPFENNFWLASAVFTSCIIQKKMQKLPRNKGLTVLIMDNHSINMPKLSDELYRRNPWFDGLYMQRVRTKKETVWKKRNRKDRLDQIVNTAFVIKSNHSSLVQVSDVICYVYRRHLELTSCCEKWTGEKDYFDNTVSILEAGRETIGQCPDDPCVQFYRSVRHPAWKL